MANISIYLFFIILVCVFHYTSAGVRRKRQDFVFPDDSQPGGIPLQFTWRPASTTAGLQFTTPTSSSFTRRRPRTTPSQRYLSCFTQCPTTSEYNPVCGTDEQLYHNEQKLRCAQKCGQEVQIVRRGNCKGLFNDLP